MKTIIIAPLGGNTETLFVGIREFPTEKIILIPSAKGLSEADKVKADLGKFKIPVEIEELNKYSMESMFEIINHIKAREKGKMLTINLGAASKGMSCAATAAAFVNGIKAFDVDNDQIELLPVLKFSYYDMLSDKKMRILMLLNNEGSLDSLEMLSRKTKLGPSLVNYHIYGNEKNPGLKELGLVEIEREDGKVKIDLTTMGKMLLKDKEISGN
ncbi:MAG: hypothetical protein CL944_02390 [Candidatus Diapherotrites archaeon]|uniref:HFX-2341-like N-terminal domain-containing protein n=1 Tax=Candidatus Iainarchaeum sp. TaxID=3101447 RepID=A0A2D6LQA1_9ARCH|nr:hypothetical protein [Candidatus Diapherotrites archaeon]|tara:strand:- start:8895 stop:9536 length:642 start_codon:yes stop_codon:yes gene_type:complete